MLDIPPTKMYLFKINSTFTIMVNHNKGKRMLIQKKREWEGQRTEFTAFERKIGLRLLHIKVILFIRKRNLGSDFGKNNQSKKISQQILSMGILEHNEIHPDQGVVLVPILDALNIDSGLGSCNFSLVTSMSL